MSSKIFRILGVPLILVSLWSSAFGQEREKLSLQEAVDTALQLNRELEAAQHGERAAHYGIWEARSLYLPQISFQGDVSKSQTDLFENQGATPTLPPPFDTLFDFDFGSFGFTGTNYNNHLQFTQLLFDRTVIGNIKLAHLREEAANMQLVGQKQQVVFGAVAAFIDILRAQELLGVQQQRLALAEKQLDTAKTNFEVGLRIRTDVLRAELTRSSALRDIVSAEIAVERAQVALNQVLGIPLDLRHDYDASLLSSYNPPAQSLEKLKNYASLFDLAEQKNPSIKVASILVDQSEEANRIAKGEFYPRLSASGRWGFREQGQLQFEDEDWSIQAAVEVPIFEGGRKLAKIRRTREEQYAEAKRYENTIRQVLDAVEQAALTLQEEHRNLDIALEAETVAHENHERFLNLYQEGLADSLDVTQALTELVEAQTNVVTTRYGYMRLYAQLLFALGIIPADETSYSTLDWLAIVQNQDVTP